MFDKESVEYDGQWFSRKRTILMRKRPKCHECGLAIFENADLIEQNAMSIYFQWLYDPLFVS